MKLKQRTTCPICHSNDISLFKKGTFDPGDLKTDNFRITDSNYGSLWNFDSCGNCGFVMSNPYVPEEDIVEFYSHLEDNEYGEEAEGRSKNFKTILKRLKRIEKKMGNRSPDCLLDIGAAGGIFLHLAREEGYKITGIEPSTYLVEEAKEKYDLQLFKGTVQQFATQTKTDGTSSTGKFSVITLLDIIEHLVEPDNFMSCVDDLISENGILILVTPDINSLAARLMRKRWWHYRIAHINFFNLRSIRTLLERHHYEIVLKKKYVWNFSVFYLLTRLFPSLKEKKSEKKSLQKILKRLHLKLPLFDSWEIYARKKRKNQQN